MIEWRVSALSRVFWIFQLKFSFGRIVILVSPRFFQDVIDGKLDKRPGSQFLRLRKTSGEGQTTRACWVRRSGPVQLVLSMETWTPRKKGCYGPPFGKRCLIFVDDLNMPAKDTAGPFSAHM